MADACRLVESWGPPHERGTRHGRTARAEIVRGVSHYLAQAAESGLSAAMVAELADGYLPIIADFEPDYAEEMRGIAEGADVPLAHIVLLNARTELMKLAGDATLRAHLAAERGADGCTTIILQPERTRDDVLVHSHNWDWKASCAATCIVLRVRQENGPDLMTFTEAGALGRIGFNAAGIAVSGNYLECERDYRRLGVPLPLIRRKVLEQDNPSLALQWAYTTPKSGSNNIALSHGPTGIVHDLECAPDETFMVEPTGGVLVHANHWLSPVALTKLRETGIADSPCSFWRQQRAERLIAAHHRLELEDLRAVLLDTAGSPLSICVPPRASSVTGCTATVASFLIRPSLGEMEIAMMPSEGAHYVRYALDDMQPAAVEPASPDA